MLVLQRLEAEKDTLTALRAWQLSGLEAEGWALRVVGDGSLRAALEARVAAEHIRGVAFIGRWSRTSPTSSRRAGVLLAPAPAEPFGLAVIEALAAGIPVVAAAAGGHLETVGSMPQALLFPPRDAAAAAEALRSLRDDGFRSTLSEESWTFANSEFTIARHVDRLLDEYGAMRRRTGAKATHAD